MSEHGQISVYDRKPAKGVSPVARMDNTWSAAHNIIPLLQQLYEVCDQRRTAAEVAIAVASIHECRMLKKDMDTGSIHQHYRVNTRTRPWQVAVEVYGKFPAVRSITVTLKRTTSGKWEDVADLIGRIDGVTAAEAVRRVKVMEESARKAYEKINAMETAEATKRKRR